MKYEYSGQLRKLTDLATNGTSDDIDKIMEHLNTDSTFAMTRFADFALSLVESEEGTKRIEYYLFNGSQIQRNYASLYLNRICEWKPVKKAYEEGLIDELQAYAR